MTANIAPDSLVSDAELAALVGVSARRIRQLAEQGRLERIERGRYALGPTLRALIEDASGSGSALVRERTRKLKADADLAELAYAKARQDVAPIEEFVKAQSAIMALIRTNVMGIAQRAIPRIIGEADESKMKTVLNEECALALRQAAEADITLEDYTDDHTTA